MCLARAAAAHDFKQMSAGSAASTIASNKNKTINDSEILICASYPNRQHEIHNLDKC